MPNATRRRPANHPARKAKQKRGTRNCWVTPRGEEILAAIEAGTYRFFTSADQPRNKDGSFRKGFVR